MKRQRRKGISCIQKVRGHQHLQNELRVDFKVGELGFGIRILEFVVEILAHNLQNLTYPTPRMPIVVGKKK